MDPVSDILDAVREGNITRVQELLNSDNTLADARAQNGDSPLMLALYYGRQDIVDLLLSRTPEIDFYEAVALGDQTRVGDFIEERPDLIHSSSHDGFTGLHLAVFFGHEEIARTLIARGADVNAIAANRSFARNAKPLHSAVAANRTALVRLLLDNGAGVNARQEGGFTALHGAAANGNEEIIRILLSFGADSTVLAADGTSAAAVGRARGHQRSAELIESKGNLPQVPPPPGGSL
jgi:ankyrin repeat protein